MYNTNNRFESEGVRRQENSLNLYQAVKQFRNSCRICCETGKNISCGSCAIRQAFINNVDYVYYDQTTPAILEMVKNEKEGA